MVSLVFLAGGAVEQTSQGKTRSGREHATPAALVEALPAGESDASAPVFLFVKGAGILRMQDGEVSSVLPTQSAVRDLELDPEGALWASLSEVGVVRHSGGKTVNLGKESFAKLAIRSATDVWAISDGQGSVVHYDGTRWKTVRTRKSFAGFFDDNRLIDIASDARSVWVTGWNGLWRVTAKRWTHVEPPPPLSSGAAPEEDGPVPPVYPLSLTASPHELLACYLAGCFRSTEAGWQVSNWPAGRARLQSAGRAGLAVGTGADGTTIVITRLDGSGQPVSSEPLTASGINDVSIDEAGRVWVACNDSLAVLDASGRAIQRWPTGALDGVNGEVHRVVVVGAGPKQLPAAQTRPHAWRGE